MFLNLELDDSTFEVGMSKILFEAYVNAGLEGLRLLVVTGVDGVFHLTNIRPHDNPAVQRKSLRREPSTCIRRWQVRLGRYMGEERENEGILVVECKFGASASTCSF